MVVKCDIKKSKSISAFITPQVLNSMAEQHKCHVPVCSIVPVMMYVGEKLEVKCTELIHTKVTSKSHLNIFTLVCFSHIGCCVCFKVLFFLVPHTFYVLTTLYTVSYTALSA